jgi:peptidoglycan/LPS O-acetylase OafA/YrhL
VISFRTPLQRASRAFLRDRTLELFLHKPGLDLLRAIAIAWVMLFHSYLVGGLGDDFSWLSRYGWMGVDLFFVLSGYLIGQQVLAKLTAGRAFSFREFYLRRAYRILPAFAVVLAVYTALPGLRESPGMEPWWKFAGFFMNLSIDYLENSAFSHAWSLCVEEHFYLLFPLLAVAMTRKPSMARFVALCVGIVLAGIALRSGVWLHDTALAEAGAPQRNWFVEDIYYPTWNRLDGLLAGVVLAAIQVFSPQWWQAAQARANVALVAGLAVLCLAFWLFRERTGLVGNSVGWPVLSLALGLLVFAGAAESGWLGRKRVPGMAWLAAVSYSLYLSHKLAFHAVQTLADGRLDGMGLLAFACYAGAALLLGAALHYGIERPFLRLRHRRARAMPVAAAPPAAVACE